MKFSLFVHMERWDEQVSHRQLFEDLTELTLMCSDGAPTVLATASCTSWIMARIWSGLRPAPSVTSIRGTLSSA